MMADKSAIEWTDATWNPVRGCTRVSPGCGGPGKAGGCYAERIAARFSGPGQPFEGFAERKGGEARWTGKVALIEDMLAVPLRWSKPRRIFVNSMSDLFHEHLPDGAIDQVFAMMALCPQHTFQVLTKRPERMRDYLSDQDPMPLPNVWLGVSAEDQARADERIPLLLETPAAVRFVSCEPLLGPIDLINLDHTGAQRKDQAHGISALWRAAAEIGLRTMLDWVICGGESGPVARPMHPDWARSLRDQCQAAGVPFFFKQWGGKKRAGRLLDGVEHNAFPEARP